MAHLPLVLVGILTGCARNVHCSFRPLDDYSLKTEPIQSLLPEGLAKPASYLATP